MKQIADALELLTAQHEDVAIALAALTTLDRDALPGALGALADQVATHLSVEEQFLTMLGLHVPLVEHAALRSALAELFTTDVESDALPARLREFETRWSAHAATQEHQIFIALAETLAPAVLTDLGTQLGTWSEQSRCVAA